MKHSVMQQDTAWWLLGEAPSTGNRDSKAAAHGSRTLEGGKGGGKEHCIGGDSGGIAGDPRGRLDRLMSSGRSKEKVGPFFSLYIWYIFLTTVLAASFFLTSPNYEALGYRESKSWSA